MLANFVILILNKKLHYCINLKCNLQFYLYVIDFKSYHFSLYEALCCGKKVFKDLIHRKNTV